MLGLLLPLLVVASAPADEALAQRAVALHRACKYDGVRGACGSAESAYREYLQRFPISPRAHAARFFRAELLWDFEEYEEAAREYGRAVEADPAGKYAREAAWNRVLSWDKAGRPLIAPAAGDPRLRLALPTARRELLAAADDFVARFPDDSRRAQALYAAGRVLYDHNHFEAAARRFAELALLPDLAKLEVGSSIAETAANFVLDGYQLLGDWPQVRSWAQRFHAAGVGTPEFRDDLLRLGAVVEIRLNRLARAPAASVWRQASQRAETPERRLDFLSQAARQDGDFREVVAGQLARVEEEPSAENLNGAASALDEAGQREQAASLRAWAEWVEKAEEAATSLADEAHAEPEECSLVLEGEEPPEE